MGSSYEIRNFVGGAWGVPTGAATVPVANPATGEVIGHTPQSPGAEVDRTVAAAAAAFPEWRGTPPGERIQYLFKLKALLERETQEIGRVITIENGKILSESLGELVRAIENVEVACGIPTMMQGDVLEDVSRGIDELMIRQPVGVCAIVCPFNFPAMIPFWFFPYALACGNVVIVKPADRTPVTMQVVTRLVEEAGLPAGVFNVVNGGADTVNALLDHPGVHAVSFVGSTAVAEHVYARASAAGKRVQAQGGAKNPIVVLPDAEIDMATQITVDSCYGNAGQRCLAASMAITVGDAGDAFTEAMAAVATDRVVGDGLDESVEMGPVISQASKQRIEHLIGVGAQEGGRLRRGRARRHRPGPGRGLVRAADIDRRRAARQHRGHHRDLRAGVRTDAGGHRGGRHRAGELGPLRQHGVPVHHRRARRAPVPLRRRRGQHRHQHRRRRPDGLLPVLRLAQQLLRRAARPRQARGGVLHPDQGGGGALARRLVPQVLRVSHPEGSRACRRRGWCPKAARG